MLSQSAVDVLDETLLLFDRAISGREAAAKQQVAEALAERAEGGENRQALLDEILTVMLDAGIGDEQIGSMLRTSIGLDRMRAAWAERRDHGQLSMLDASMSYLRHFAPAVLPAVGFDSRPGTEQLMQAVGILTGRYATGARRVPADAPVGFVPTKWAGYLVAAGQAGDVTGYPRYWELAVLRDGQLSGDIFVPGSGPLSASKLLWRRCRPPGPSIAEASDGDEDDRVAERLTSLEATHEATETPNKRNHPPVLVANPQRDFIEERAPTVRPRRPHPGQARLKSYRHL